LVKSILYFFYIVAFLVLPFFGQLPFWQRQLPFWFSIFAFLALIRADWYDILWYEICLSGSKKNRLVRDSSGSYKSRFSSSRQQVREVLVGRKAAPSSCRSRRRLMNLAVEAALIYGRTASPPFGTSRQRATTQTTA
jgi:hypothetical protein